MNQSITTFQLFLLLGVFLLVVLLAVVAGIFVAVWLQRYQSVHNPARIGGSAGRFPVNTEVSAQRQIAKESIERGAEEIIANANAQGVNISKKEAREQAARMLAGMDPLGGAH